MDWLARLLVILKILEAICNILYGLFSVLGDVIKTLKDFIEDKNEEKNK